MLKLILRQTNWGIFGSVFGFSLGFFVKIYLLDIVGLDAWGKYVTVQTFISFIETFLSIGIPYVIIRFIPTLIDKNIDKASSIVNIFLKYALIIGTGFLVLNYFISPSIAKYVYSEIDDLSYLLFLMSIHVPITMLFGIVISLYRSMLKIKEIVIYGTIVMVLVRAISTFIVFQFTKDISYFIFIEIFTQILVLSILLFLFNKNQFPVFVKSDPHDILKDKEMISYGKKMFLSSMISFIAAWSLSFIISIKLPSADVGAYNILLTLTGLTTFLLINLNKVMAPAITKLYNENKILELNNLYKKTTFLINIFTIPLSILIVLFADEILGMYTYEMVRYKPYLCMMMLGGIVSLAAGSSGTLMIMVGLEKQNLYIQLIRALLLIVLSLSLIQFFGMLIIVILYVISMLFVNASQLIYIKQHLNISPFSRQSLVLFLLTFIGMYFAMNQNIDFEVDHYILAPIIAYLVYFLVFYKQLKQIFFEIR